MPISTPADLPPLTSLRPLVDRFHEARLVVCGDVVADRFLYGSTTRISREAPALVVRRETEEIRPGGAGNAIMNAAALGARVAAVGYIGGDATGDALRAALEEAGVDTRHLLARDDAPTPVKTRVMAGGRHTVRQQILRIDADERWPADDTWLQRLDAALAAALDDTNALLLSDYGMGSAAPQMIACRAVDLRATGRALVVDSRCALLQYRGAAVVTPNEEEAEEALGIRPGSLDDQLESAGERLLAELGCDAALITRGSRGMALFEAGGTATLLPIHGSDQIADVTGAGDTVIATLTAALVVGASMLQAARLANIAAGLVVMKRGTATVSAGELRAALEAGA
jgi:rfaE bifunctional protein kinase chain/domain